MGAKVWEVMSKPRPEAGWEGSVLQRGGTDVQRTESIIRWSVEDMNRVYVCVCVCALVRAQVHAPTYEGQRLMLDIFFSCFLFCLIIHFVLIWVRNRETMRNHVHTNTNTWHVSRSQRTTFKVNSLILPDADRVSLVSVIVFHTLLRVGCL